MTDDSTQHAVPDPAGGARWLVAVDGSACSLRAVAMVLGLGDTGKGRWGWSVSSAYWASSVLISSRSSGVKVPLACRRRRPPSSTL